MARAFELTVYEIVQKDTGWTVIRRADGKTARVKNSWLILGEEKAQAASQTKQIRIDGADWE